jgi:hypothetical protein
MEGQGQSREPREERLPQQTVPVEVMVAQTSVVGVEVVESGSTPETF